MKNFETLLCNVGFRCDEYNYFNFSMGEKFGEKFSYYGFNCKRENDKLKVEGYSYNADGRSIANFDIDITDKTESEVLFEILSNEQILNEMSKAWQQEITLEMVHEKLKIEFKNKQYFRFIDVADNAENVLCERCDHNNVLGEVKIYKQLNNGKHVIEVIQNNIF